MNTKLNHYYHCTFLTKIIYLTIRHKFEDKTSLKILLNYLRKKIKKNKVLNSNKMDIIRAATSHSFHL